MARIPKFRFPAGQVVDYYNDIRSMLIKAHENVLKAFESRIVPLVRQRNDSLKLDDELVDITIILDTLRKETLTTYFAETAVTQAAKSFVTSIQNHTMSQFGRQFKAVLKVDPLSRDSKLFGIAQAAVKENVSYIESIPTKYHDQVETVILQGVRRGKSIGDMADELQGIYNTTRDRAKFIARDQAGSLLGDMTKAQHQSVGLETFIWSTAGDNNVRSSHAAFEGLRFRWDTGAGPEGLIPGEDYGCRCVAELDEEALLNL